MKNATSLTITGLLAVGLMFGVNLAQAQNIGKPGTLDPKFGTDGTVTTIFTGVGSPVMLPIPGTSSVAHVEDNIAAARLALSDAEYAALESAVS